MLACLSPRARNVAGHLVCRVIPVLAVLAVLPVAARADRPQAVYIFPAGGQRGTDVNVRIGGLNLHQSPVLLLDGDGLTGESPLQPTTTLWFEGPRIRQPASQRKETYPRDYQSTFHIDQQARQGLHRWHLATSQGVTTGCNFVVGDLPEIVEQEIDGEPVPQPVRLPVTINGRIFPREDIDIWTVELQAGQTVACEVMAARLGSPLDSRLEVRGPGGQLLGENVDALGTDSRLVFTAREAGRHSIHIHDISFAGLQHYVYRLTLTTGPVVDAIYPLGGQRGTQTVFELSGHGLETDSVSLSLPSGSAESWSWQPPHREGSQPFALELSAHPEFREAEPNDTAETAYGVGDRHAVPAPAILNGRIDQPGDTDGWWLQAQPGTRFQVEVRAAVLGSQLDSVIEVVAPDGRVLAQADDRGTQPDSRLTFAPPTEGRCLLKIRDRLASRGGPLYAYRVEFSPAPEADAVTPDFSISTLADAASIDRGSSEKLKLKVVRHGKFTGDITVSAVGLPAGVTAEPLVITEKTRNPVFELQAAEQAVVVPSATTLIATAMIDGQLVEHPVTFDDPRSTSNVGSVPGRLMVSAAVPTPFRFVGAFESKFAARGTTYRRHYTIERDDFDGPLVARMAEDQARHLQGVTADEVSIAAGGESFDIAVRLAPWMEIGRTSRTCVMLVGEVVDPDGTRHTVSYTSHEQNDQVIVLTDPARLGLRLGQTAVRLSGPQQVKIPVTVSRGTGLRGPVHLRLQAPSHLAGFASGSLTVPAGESNGDLQITFHAPPGPVNMPLQVEASIADEHGNPVVALARLEVVLIDPDATAATGD